MKSRVGVKLLHIEVPSPFNKKGDDIVQTF